jgi:hypothetical protein
LLQVLTTDWNETVREAAVEQLANATRSDDPVAVDAILKALQVWCIDMSCRAKANAIRHCQRAARVTSKMNFHFLIFF